MPYFDRFTQSWAVAGNVIEPTSAQADAGFAYLGPVPPSVEGFNAMFQWNDNKDTWLYHQISNVILDAGIPVTEADLDALLNAIDQKIQAMNPAGGYLPLTGGVLTGPGNLEVQGTLRATNWGRILSVGGTPTIGVSNTAGSYVTGFSTDGSTKMSINQLGGDGAILTEWGNFTPGQLNYTGNVNASGDLYAGESVHVGTSNAFLLMQDPGGNRALYWDSAQGYNFHWTPNGTVHWGYPTGEMTLDNTGSLTVNSTLRVTNNYGIQYTGIDATNWIAFGWDAVNSWVNAWVNGVYTGSLATTANLTGYVWKAGDAMTGGLTVPVIWDTSTSYMDGASKTIFSSGTIIATTDMHCANLYAPVGAVEGASIRTPGSGAYLNGNLVNASIVNAYTVQTSTQEPRAYLSGPNIWAASDLNTGGNVICGYAVYISYPAVATDYFLTADYAACYLKFNGLRYWNYERATGNTVYWAGAGRAFNLIDSGSMELFHPNAWKQATNTWDVSSDDRIKNVQGDYTKGLAEVLALKPILYTYNNDFEGVISPRLENLDPKIEDPPPIHKAYQRASERQDVCIGLSAQQTEAIMPEMITNRKARIAGVEVDDFKGLNTHALTFAFINAFKEVNARLLALEGSA
jgi:hypothetical protein